MYTTSDFRRGLRIEYEGHPYLMVEFQHHKPGKGAAIVRTRLKNLVTGNTIDPTFRSGDKVGKPDLDQTDAQYLYNGDGVFHFMDPVSYDQHEVPEDSLGDAPKYLVENTDVELLFYQGRVISIELPNHVVLTVTECDPAVKGDTVQGATKPATMETGHSTHVPLFVNEGDKLRIDTRTGEYIERA